MARIGVIVAAAFLIRLVVIALHHGAAIDVTGAEYARLGENLHDGAGYVGMRGFTTTHDPPLYPLLIAAALVFVRDAQLAGELVAALAGTALVFFVYRLADAVYGRHIALLAAVFAAIVPIEIIVSTQVLADAVFDAAVVAGVWLLVRTSHQVSAGTAPLAAVAFMLAFWARPEGLALVVYAIVALAFLALRGRLSPRPAVAVAATAVVLMIPYLLFTYATTGQARLQDKSGIDLAVSAGERTGHSYVEVAHAIDDQGTPIGPVIDPRFYDPRATPPQRATFGERLRLIAQAEIRHIGEVMAAFGSAEYGAGTLFVLAVAGLAVGTPWSGNRRRDEALLIGAVVALYVPLGTVWHFGLAYGAALAAITSVWAAKGIFALREWSRTSRLPDVGNLALATFALVACVIDLRLAVGDRVDAPERDAGAWIAQQVHGARVVDVSDRVAYYGGGIWSPLPYGSADAARRYLDRVHPDFIVLDTRRTTAFPPLRTWFAAGPPGDVAQLVRVVPAEGGALRVYRWTGSTARQASRT